VRKLRLGWLAPSLVLLGLALALAAPDPMDATAAFPGANARIAYISKGGDIWTTDPDGKNAKLTIASAYFPEFSPDGKQMAYTAAGGQVMIAGADGSNPAPVGTVTGYETAFSPAGDMLAVSRAVDYKSVITVVKLPGGETVRTFTGPDEVGYASPEWNPTASGIDLLVTRQGPSGKGDDPADLARLTDAGEVPVTTSAPQVETAFDWSPDGKSVLFSEGCRGYMESCGGGSGTNRIISMDLATGARRIVEDLPDFTPVDAAYSPDGTAVAYFKQGQLWVEALDPKPGDAPPAMIAEPVSQFYGLGWGGSTVCQRPGARAARAGAVTCPLIVSSVSDAEDANATDGQCDTDREATGAQCTLRAALQEANRRPAGASIIFDLPGGASPEIVVGKPLPESDTPVQILGHTQPGGGPVRVVGAGGGFSGLVLKGKGSRVSKLVVGGFGGDGIVLAGGGGHTIVASFIGTDPSRCANRRGAACPLGNGRAGVRITSSDNRIGMESRPVRELPFDRADPSVIANNRGAGVAITDGQRNQAANNNFGDNGGLPIDLGDDGVTRNDASDADEGPNGLLNAPVVTGQKPAQINLLSATNQFSQVPGFIVNAVLQTTPKKAGFVSFIPYVEDACPSPYAGTARVQGSEGGGNNVVSDTGSSSNSGSVPAPDGKAVTFTATDTEGNVSELSNCFVDEDEDGINDHWETAGADIDRDDKAEVDLKAMGADPRRKDIFVQVDWMTGHGIDDVALNEVRKAFDQAPVKNPGAPGIHIHIDNGENSVMDFKTGRKWGKLSRSTEVPRTAGTGGLEKDPFTGKPSGYDWGDVDKYAERFLEPTRRVLFHYAFSAERIAGLPDGVLGLSRGIPGRDFILGLQPLCPDDTPCAGPPTVQAAALMHELGHNLDLTHGGVGTMYSQTNLKPNFLSLMNYVYVPEGIREYPESVGIFDYSRIGNASRPGVDGWVGDLDETKLDEKAGFAPRGRAIDSPAAWFCPKAPGVKREMKTIRRLSGPMDFNCNGKIDEEPLVKHDLTLDVDFLTGKPKPEYYLLEGASEWDVVDLRSGTGGLLTNPQLPLGTLYDMPAKEIQEIARAKLRDRKKPKLTIKQPGARKGRKRARAVVVRAADDRRIETIVVTVGKKTYTKRAGRKAARKLSLKVKLQKGRHSVRAVAYDAALRSAARNKKLRIR
jgi:hypothetical protein